MEAMIIYCDGLLCCTIVVSAFFFNRTWTLRCCLVAVPFRGSAESMTRQHNTLVLKSRQQQHPRFACVIPRVCEYLLGNAENILSSSHVKRTSKGFVAVNEELRQQRHDRYRSLFYDWGHSLGQPFFATLSLRIGCSGIVIVNFFGSIFGKMTVSFVTLPPRQPRPTLGPRNMLHRELPRIFHLVSLPYITSVIASGAKR